MKSLLCNNVETSCCNMKQTFFLSGLGLGFLPLWQHIFVCCILSYTATNHFITCTYQDELSVSLQL